MKISTEHLDSQFVFELQNHINRWLEDRELVVRFLEEDNPVNNLWDGKLTFKIEPLEK